jgi:intraflagellar transport protein 140
VNENSQCSQCFSLDHAIIKLLFYEEKNVVVTLTENLMLAQHAVMPEGDTKELMKVCTCAIL